MSLGSRSAWRDESSNLARPIFTNSVETSQNIQIQEVERHSSASEPPGVQRGPSSELMKCSETGARGRALIRKSRQRSDKNLFRASGHFTKKRS